MVEFSKMLLRFEFSGPPCGIQNTLFEHCPPFPPSLSPILLPGSNPLILGPHLCVLVAVLFVPVVVVALPGA